MCHRGIASLILIHFIAVECEDMTGVWNLRVCGTHGHMNSLMWVCGYVGSGDVSVGYVRASDM